GIEIADGLGEVRTVHIGNEAEGHGVIAVVPQRFVGHHRAEVGAADADVDEVANALAPVAPPSPLPPPIAELPHLVQNRLNRPTFRPSGMIEAPGGARSATCSTERFSVILILSPRNMASMRSRSPASWASRISRPRVSSVMRFFE